MVKHARWLAHLGDHAYTTALLLNRAFNAGRLELIAWTGDAMAPAEPADDDEDEQRAA